MNTILGIFLIILLSLALIGWLADRRAADREPGVTPGLSSLPGDIKYESSDGKIPHLFSYRNVDRPILDAECHPPLVRVARAQHRHMRSRHITVATG